MKSLMIMMMVTAVGVSLMGSHALTCYKCENTIYGIDVKAPHTAFGSHKCFVVWQNTSTCEAKKYCTKLMNLCPHGMIYPFILSSILF